MKCDDAQVTQPQFDKVMALDIVPTDDHTEAELRPLVDIGAFIERTVRNAPESVRQALQARLNTKLFTESNKDIVDEGVWRACTANALTADEYNRKRDDYLLKKLGASLIRTR